MDPKDIKGNSEPIYEHDDIPLIVGNEEDGYGIFWSAKEGLSPRLSEGLELNEAEYEACYNAIKKIKERYFPEGYHGYDEWRKNENGTYYLRSLIPHPGGGVLMYIYAHEGEPLHLNAGMFRLDLHNVDCDWQALFFQECLVEYLKHVGINVPGIRSEVVETKMIKWGMGDSKKEVKTNILSYSFELPYLKESEHLLLVLLERFYNIDAEVQENQILVDGKAVLEKRQKEDGDIVWIGENLKGVDVIKLFYTLARSNSYLRRNL